MNTRLALIFEIGQEPPPPVVEDIDLGPNGEIHRVGPNAYRFYRPDKAIQHVIPGKRRIVLLPGDDPTPLIAAIHEAFDNGCRFGKGITVLPAEHLEEDADV